jgi:hypothetical protein
MDIKLMTEDECRTFIGKQTWTFAKTMPKIPHCYIVKAKVASDEDFERFVATIYQKGTVKPWGRYNHTYYEIDGMNYWSMGYPVKETTIINQQKVEDFHKGPWK